MNLSFVQLEVSWPLQSSEGDWLLYLTETPYVLYSAGRARLEEEEECLIDPQLVNNRNLGKARQTRQLDEGDYGTDYGTGVLIDNRLVLRVSMIMMAAYFLVGLLITIILTSWRKFSIKTRRSQQ